MLAIGILLVGVMIFLLLIWLTLCAIYSAITRLTTAVEQNKIELIRNRTERPPVSLRLAPISSN